VSSVFRAGPGENYAKLLESVFLIKRLPAWGTTLQSRIATPPKLHVNDSGILGHLLKFSQAKLKLKDAPTQTEFGHVLETFAYGEISRQVELSDEVVGSQFLGGYVLNLGPRSYTYEDRLHCISLDRLWKS